MLMLTPLPPDRHVWYSAADCAALLDATKHGTEYRARCPAHSSDNPTSLAIGEGTSSTGHPVTLFYCFAQQCSVEEICAALGIEPKQLFAIQPAYARATRNAPRARSPRVERLKTMQDTTPDQIAQILLEELIVSDPPFIQECVPARQKLWELAQASSKAKNAFLRALQQAGLAPRMFWEHLTHQQKAMVYGDTPEVSGPVGDADHRS